MNDPLLEKPVVRFADGEYYSPMYDTRELWQRRNQLWSTPPRETVGIKWREASQLALCRDVFARQEHFPFPAEPCADHEYFGSNGMYPPLDAWILEGLMRHYRPSRMIEVGCGFSTLVSARVNRQYLNGALDLTCIEPYPRPFLTEGITGLGELLVAKVQDVPLTLFESLQSNDILFIDTSHTVKTGGDVTWIFHEIIPRLAPGVLVHIHDIYLPGEYPESWVMEGWGWNETYLAQSFLMFNEVFEIVWGTLYMLIKHLGDVRTAFPALKDHPDQGGASFWMRRVS